MVKTVTGLLIQAAECSEWIYVMAGQLPPFDQRVIVLTKEGDVEMAYLDSITGRGPNFRMRAGTAAQPTIQIVSDIIWWMPLPEPPT